MTLKLNKSIIFTILLFVPFISEADQINKNFGPTVACDDLWQIANKINHEQDITPQQIMIALLEKNPKIFYQHNINGLLRGYKLSIPSTDEIKKIPSKKAKLEVKKQNIAWKNIAKELNKHPSKEYLELRKKCCTNQHFANLAERFHEKVKQSQSDSQPAKIELQSQIETLNNENQSLKKEIEELTNRNKSLQNDITVQWSIIEKTKLENKNIEHTHKTNSTYNIKNKTKNMSEYLLRLKQQLTEDTQNQKESIIDWWINKIKALDPFMTISIGSTILFSIILLWAANRYQKKSYQFKKTKFKKEQEIESGDIVSTKLDLARAYIDMGESDRAKGILKNVLQKGNLAQKTEANILLKEIR